MKVKHFAQYGNITMKKLSKTDITENKTILVVLVSGLHEQGLTPHYHDSRLINSWIVKRFERRDIETRFIEYNTIEGYSPSMTEYAVFTIEYERREL